MDEVDNLIKALVDLDREAQRQIAQARREFQEFKKDLAAEKEEIYNEYIAHAGERIDKMHKYYKQELDDAVHALNTRFAEARSELEALYKENRDEWLEAITGRCTSKEDN